MEIKDIISGGKPFLQLEKPEKALVISGEDSLQNVGQEKITALKNSIEEINYLIKQREELSKKLSDEVEKIKTDIENFLLKNESQDSESFKEKNGLRKKQIEISELQLTERVNCWRDVAQLKKELRQKQGELTEKEDRMKMLDQILED
ncbi:MAG: hypothetical protein ABIB79_03655 [archaeon]